MVVSLLTTKLYIPQPQPHGRTVFRPRLIERLDGGLRLGRRLFLLSAPAGYGKTTLLGEWIGSAAQSTRYGVEDTGAERTRLVSAPAFSWLSLDEADNDPTRFWAYVIAALQTIPLLREAGVGNAALTTLQGPAPLGAKALPVEGLLSGLINEIAAVPGAGRYVLVLDDYHLIEAGPIHDALAFLIDHLPPRFHLVLATRADPPLPIPRFRGRGQVTELRQADLRFTAEEAAAFLHQAMGLHISPADVATLTARTEGWIAGLQMAAVSMQGQDDIAAFVQAFTGSHRFVLDYLVEEVLHRQAEEVQRFLLRTSILERLTAPLCDAVLGKGEKGKREKGESGQEILEHLERANLFVVPLDDRREWYRYHRLLADLLQKRLQQSSPDLIPVLYARASAWHEQRGHVDQAIRYALSGHAFERAADLVARVAEDFLMRSQVATLLGWIAQLPDDLVRARPSLAIHAAWALILGGHAWDKVESQLLSMDAELVFDQVTSMRAFMAVVQGQIADAVALCRQALERLPEDSVFLRSFVSWLLSASYLAAGDLEAGNQMLEETIRASQESGNVMVAAGALTQAARLCVRQGQLYEAKSILERAIQAATDQDGRALPVAGRAMIALGNLIREWNDLDGAVRCLEQGIALIEQWRGVAAMPGYIALARARQAQGDAAGAVEAMQRAGQLARAFDATDWDDVLVDTYRARLWLDQGNVQAAARWAEGRDAAERIEEDELLLHHMSKYEDIVRARLAIALGQPDQALALLESLLERLDQHERRGLVIEIQILKALALRARSRAHGAAREADSEQAIAAMERALRLAEPGGYVRIFCDEGEMAAQLLREAAARGVAVDYVNRLLAAFQGAHRLPSPAAHPDLVEPLSERELEVLRYLASSLTTPEIARELIVSVHTVRSHIKSIYGKLDVHRRADAVERAKELALL